MAGTGLHATYQTQLTDVWTKTTKHREAVGTLRYEGQNTFKVLAFSANSNIVPGNPCFALPGDYSIASGSPVGPHSEQGGVRRQATATSVLLGVAMFTAPATAGVGWFQIKGLCKLSTGALAAGTADHDGLMQDATAAARLKPAVASVVVTNDDDTAFDALSGNGTRTLETPVKIPPIHAVAIDASERAVFLMCPE